MPARRSRTERWQDSLGELAARRGPIELSVPSGDAQSLNWRVRVLDLSADRIVVEHPVTLNRRVPLSVGGSVVCSISIGQNRWMFTTAVVGLSERDSGGRSQAAVELLMPDEVERCQRRSFYRISTASLQLPEVRCATLEDPADAVPLQIATRAAILESAGAAGPAPSLDLATPTFGMSGEGVLLNIGGGGACLRMPPTCGAMLDRPSYFLLQIDLTPNVPLPLPVTAKLAHTRVDSSQAIQAGFSFDFALNPEYGPFLSEVICRYIAGLQTGARSAA